MRFLENPEQPELTGKDLQQILQLIFTEGKGPPLPDFFQVKNVEHETRLKFNAPTPVVSMDGEFVWNRAPVKLVRAQLMYWQIDQQWEVADIEIEP